MVSQIEQSDQIQLYSSKLILWGLLRQSFVFWNGSISSAGLMRASSGIRPMSAQPGNPVGRADPRSFGGSPGDLPSRRILSTVRLRGSVRGGGDPTDFTDDALGRALIKLQAANPRARFAELSRAMIAEWGLPATAEVHADTSTITLYGKYPGADALERPDEAESSPDPSR